MDDHPCMANLGTHREELLKIKFKRFFVIFNIESNNLGPARLKKGNTLSLR